MSKPPKIDRKSLKQPDEFQSKGREYMAWVDKHRPLILALILGVVAIGLLNFGYGWYQHNQLEKAWVAYSRAEKLPAPRKWEDMKTVHQQWGSYRASLFAAVSLADHHLEAARQKDAEPAEMDSALEWYTKALEFSGLLPTEKQLLLINVGNVLELKQDLDGALARYEEAAGVDGHSRALALLSKGRVLELKKDPEGAKKVYEQVGEDFPDTEFAKMAKNHLRRLFSPLFQASE